jgi:hypothetical protein
MPRENLASVRIEGNLDILSGSFLEDSSEPAGCKLVRPGSQCRRSARWLLQRARRRPRKKYNQCTK